MTGLKRYAALFILPLGLALISTGARQLSRSCFGSFVNFRAPQFTVKSGSHADPVNRVVLVVVDGLRVDAFNKMRYISSLKERGAVFTLKTGQPSFSLPGSAVIATGAWPEVTGVTTNWFKGPIGRDNLFSMARDRGLRAVFAGGTSWSQLFGGAAAEAFTPNREHAYTVFDEETLERGLEFLSGNPVFSLFHFIDADAAGHDFGGASPEYQKYADQIDGLIERLHRSLPEDSVLIVTSDHGQTDRGGHGGWETVVTRVPLLLYGSVVKPGSYGMAQQTDIAPTVAALLGLPVPPYSQGRILAEALNLGGQAARLRELEVEHKEAFTRAYLGAAGVDLKRLLEKAGPVPAGDAGPYWAGVLAKGKADRIRAESVRRIPPFVIILLVPLLSYWYFGKRLRLSFRVPLVFSFLYFASFYGIFFASGKTVSLSSVKDEGLFQEFIGQTMLYAALSAVIVAIGLAFRDRRRTGYETARDSVLLASFIDFLLLVQIDVFWLYNGPLLGWHIPDMFLGFKYYLDLTSLVAIGFVSVFLPFISLGAHRVFAGSSKGGLP